MTTAPPARSDRPGSLDSPLGRALDALLHSRRSVRRYLDRPVPREVLDAVLEAARWAPSPHNSQPLRLAVLAKQSARERFAATMGERWRADLAADGLAPDRIDQLVGKSRERIAGAPVAVVLCLTYADLDNYPDPRRQAAEQLMAAHSLGAAAQNMMLAAHARGLASCWMCAPVFCPEVVRQALGLPAQVIPQALITLGYAAAVPPVRERRPLSDLVLFDA